MTALENDAAGGWRAQHERGRREVHALARALDVDVHCAGSHGDLRWLWDIPCHGQGWATDDALEILRRLAANQTYRRRRSARELAVSAGDKITIHALIVRDGNACGICGEEIDAASLDRMLQPSIDHIVPISRSGLHVWENTQPAHLICNIRKGDHVPDQGAA